jgi:transposase
MPRPYSMNLRERAVEAVKSGASRREIAEIFKVGVRLGRVDKLNPDSDGGKQHEGGEALGQFVVASGDPT